MRLFPFSAFSIPSHRQTPTPPNIQKVRVYHAVTKYYVELDITMSEHETLKVTDDVSEALQRKLEGLADVEQAFVHVDYGSTHDISEEHKSLYNVKESNARRPVLERGRRGWG